MKLSKRFLTIPVVLALFAFLFYSSYRNIKDKTLNDFNLQQFTLAKQASRGIESFFIYYQRELSFLSSIPSVSSLNKQGENLLADFYKTHSDQIEAITMVDSKGVLKYTYPINESVIGKNISDQQHVKTVISTHKPTVSEVFNSVQGFTAIAYHVPVISDNEYTGSIAILIPLEKLGKRFVENIKSGETGYGWMISKSGIQLFSPSTDQHGKNVAEIYNGNSSVLNLINRSSADTIGTSVCYLKNAGKETKVLAGFYRIPLVNTFWTIIIFTPEKEVFAKLTSFRNRLYFLISMIIIVMSIYYYLTLKASNILKEEKKRKAVEKILSQSQEKMLTLSRALESIGECVSITDFDNKIIYANNAFCECYGYSKEEIIGKNISITRPENNLDQSSEKIISDTIYHGWTGELINIRKDGSLFPIELSTSSVKDENGNAVAMIGIAVDITERKRITTELIEAKEKAEESDRLKSSFLANMSHELRTPLNAIIGFSGLMISSGPDKDTVTYSEIILKSGHHLLNLVEDIFDITMIESGQFKINCEKTEITGLLTDVRNIIMGERLLEGKDTVELKINSNNHQNHSYINTDPARLKQILINLLRNAIKFTEEGFIEFGYCEMNGNLEKYFQFYVKDTGIGIDSAYHDIIFNIFQQIDDTHTRRAEGMGIGLSIVKRIVEFLGGKIWLESQPSLGSTFYFTIPDKSYNLN